MSTTLTRSQKNAPTAALPHLTFGGLISSEWIKLRSLRSTMWSFALIILTWGGLGLLIATTIETKGSDPWVQTPTGLISISVVAGSKIAQLIAAVLGALIVTGEYSTGMIRTTLTAAPKRTSAYLAKAIVLFVSTYIVAIVSAALAYLLSAIVLISRGQSAPLFEGDTIQNMLGTSLYVALVALFALGLGTIIRSGAGAIAAALGSILVLPIVLFMIPGEWVRNIRVYLLDTAGSRLTGQEVTMNEAGDVMGYGVAILLAVAWTAASLIIGGLLLKRRDA